MGNNNCFKTYFFKSHNASYWYRDRNLRKRRWSKETTSSLLSLEDESLHETDLTEIGLDEIINLGNNQTKHYVTHTDTPEDAYEEPVFLEDFNDATKYLICAEIHKPPTWVQISFTHRYSLGDCKSSKTKLPKHIMQLITYIDGVYFHMVIKHQRLCDVGIVIFCEGIFCALKLWSDVLKVHSKLQKSVIQTRFEFKYNFCVENVLQNIHSALKIWIDTCKKNLELSNNIFSEICW